MAAVYAVILAGGGGTRLWPLSRPERPKPFLPLLGETTLLQRTAARLEPLVAPEDVYVVTDRRYAALVAEQLPAMPAANLLGEPVGRNTAAAVAYAAAAIDRPADEAMLILPADHQVLDEVGFRDALAVAGDVARGAPDGASGRLVTLGIEPSGPETGYGYVLARGRGDEVGGRPVFEVERFVEKPSVERARELLAGGLASWNAGIFAWTRGTIRAALRRHAADILEPIEAAVGGGPEALAVAYPGVRATSIDYAVMEPASLDGAVRVVPMAVGWSDLGSWAALRDALVAEARAAGETGEVVGSGRHRDVGSSGTLVLARDRLVVTIGLRDTIVIETPDALLVCAADRSQDVRGVAEELARAREEPA